jgi:hypothetical protein
MLTVKQLRKEDAADGLEKYVQFVFHNTMSFMIMFFPFQYFGGSEIQNLYTFFGGRNFILRIAYQLVECFIATNFFTIAVFYNFLIVGALNSMIYWLIHLK